MFPFLVKIGVAIVGGGIIIASYFGLRTDRYDELEQAIEQLKAESTILEESVLGAVDFRLVVTKPARLLQGISTSDTSVDLAELVLPDDTEVQMSNDFGTIGYATIDPNTSRKELISFTGVTQDASTTKATLTGITRGLKFNFPYDAGTGLAKNHSGAARVVFSNPPQVYSETTANRNDENITGIWGFNTAPIELNSTSATATNQFATRGFVLNQSNQGAADISLTVKGIGKLALASEAASSTSPEGTASTTVIGIHLTSATPIGRASSTIPVAVPSFGSLTPVFNPQYVATSGVYVWGNSHTFNGGITILANSTTTNTFTLNGTARAWPQGYPTGSSSVLVSDAGGALSFAGDSSLVDPLLGSVIMQDFSLNPPTNGNANFTASTTLLANTLLPGGVVAIDLSATSSIKDSTAGNEPSSYSIEVSLGGSASSTCGYRFSSAGAEKGGATTTFRFIIRRLALNKQSITCTMTGSGSAGFNWLPESLVSNTAITSVHLQSNQKIFIMASSSQAAMNGTARMSISGITVELKNPR